MPSFTARRNHLGNYKLLVDGQSFGTLYLTNGTVTGGWFRDQDVKDAHRRLMLNGMARKTLADHLAVCRAAYEVMLQDEELLEAQAAYHADEWQRALEEGRR